MKILTKYTRLPQKLPQMIELQKSVKEQSLIRLLLSVLESSEHADAISVIMEKLGLSKTCIIESFLHYNMDVHDHGNEIYHSLAIRLVLHIHNLIKNSWHIERQQTVDYFINVINPSWVLDLGFGVPSLYVKNLLSRKNFKATLCDFSASAIKFARTLLNFWSKYWKEFVELKKEDLAIVPIKFDLNNYDFFIFQDSIEHIEEPAKHLSSYVINSTADSHFILSLPIGPITPEHSMEWMSVKDATAWLEGCGLKIIKSKIIRTNPEVDLFADVHEFNYSDFYALCSK